MKKDFLTLLDFSTSELHQLIQRADELKKMHKNKQIFEPLKGRVLAMIFEKSSTRTRISFEAGMAQLGGSAIFLSSQDSQLGRGEPLADTAKVMSEMVDAIMIRTFAHKNIEILAQNATIPVINALSDDYHPCQLLADMQAFFEHRGDIKGATVTWVGDGNNMCNSYINAAERFDFNLNLAIPQGYYPPEGLTKNNSKIKFFDNVEDACRDVDLVVTDVWASMGQEEEQKARIQAFANFQVSEEVLDLAQKDVLFMHCLPAHRGEEISKTLLDDKRAIVWDEAGNRLHAQKALLEKLILG